jgi:hypothetical protein
MGKPNKPVIGVPATGKMAVPDEVGSLCDACCEWDAIQFLGTIDRIRELPKFHA